MSILNLYQMTFVGTVVTTCWVAFRAKRHAVTQSVGKSAIAIAKPVVASLDLVKEKIRKLDQLFDENRLTVDEYVEMRRKIAGETQVG